MKTPPIDPELLARLLDGTLDEKQRQKLLQDIASSEEDLEALGDAAMLMRDLEQSGALADARATSGNLLVERSPASAPQSARGTDANESLRGASTEGEPRRFRLAAWKSRWGIVASAAVVLLAAGLAYWRSDARSATYGPRELVAALTEVSLGARVTPAVAWPAVRGTGDELTPRALGVRFGAEAVAMEVAERAGDSATLTRTANRVAQLLVGQTGAGPVLQVYQRVAANNAISSRTRREWLTNGWTLGATLVGPELAQLGAWLATVRVAAEQRDTAFFRRARLADLVRALERDAAVDDAETRSARERLLAMLRRGSVDQWEVLHRDVTTMLLTLGT